MCHFAYSAYTPCTSVHFTIIPIVFMFFRRMTAQSLFLLLFLIIPVESFGASFLPTDGTVTVSRGDFLREAVTQLAIPYTKNAKSNGTYTRSIPKSLESYVSAGEKQKALVVFGKDLALSKTITRGEAAALIALLLHIEPSSVSMSFTDIKANSVLERGARVVVEKGWMKPVRSTLFGADRSLTSAEARDIFLKASSSSQLKIPAMSIKYKSVDKADLPEATLLRTIWQLVNQQYVYEENIDAKEAAYRAAEGLMNSLNDPYTIFMRPLDAKQFQSQIDGQVSGIGAQVEYQNNALTVVAPISGSPAQKAGMKAGDIITEVDGISLAGLNLIQAVDKIRGPKGTEVTLTIERDGSKIKITLTRATVKLPEIDISMQDGFSIVRLVQFGQTTDTQLRALMTDIAKKNVKGLILDLRNNPGGLLHAAEITLSNFLPEGSAVAVIQSKDDEYTEVTTEKPTISPDTPIVVLVNKGSASASEIVAGALQDHKRAIIVGETSFGKGTVQQIIEFKDGSSLKMTIAEWLTPDGRAINKTGVIPDVPVDAGDGTRDEQLLKALDLLR